MFWSEEDSNNLKRIANALEEISGKKTFVPSNEKVNIDVVENNDEESTQQQENLDTKVNSILEKNQGKHLWEETNLEELADELVEG